MTGATQEFTQWLDDRMAAIEAELKHASDHNRMLLKTERGELTKVMLAYKRIVLKDSPATFQTKIV